jgi:hypothetical protein
MTSEFVASSLVEDIHNYRLGVLASCKSSATEIGRYYDITMLVIYKPLTKIVAAEWQDYTHVMGLLCFVLGLSLEEVLFTRQQNTWFVSYEDQSSSLGFSMLFVCL